MSNGSTASRQEAGARARCVRRVARESWLVAHGAMNVLQKALAAVRTSYLLMSSLCKTSFSL